MFYLPLKPQTPENRRQPLHATLPHKHPQYMRIAPLGQVPDESVKTCVRKWTCCLAEVKRGDGEENARAVASATARQACPSRPVSRVLCERVSAPGDHLSRRGVATRSSSLPEVRRIEQIRTARRTVSSPRLALLPTGVARPPTLQPTPVVSYTAVSPSPVAGQCASLWPCSGRSPRPGNYPASCSEERGLSSNVCPQPGDTCPRRQQPSRSPGQLGHTLQCKRCNAVGQGTSRGRLPVRA